MSSTKIREKLHDYIERGDDRFLKIVYAMAKEYLEGEPSQYELSDEQVKVLNERRQRYLSGEGETFTLKETLERARSQKKKK